LRCTIHTGVTERTYIRHVSDPRFNKVSVRFSGERVLLSSEDADNLDSVVSSLAEEGVPGLRLPIRVDGRWVASFDNPLFRQCVVETTQSQTVVSGPSRDMVLVRAQEFLYKGALVAGGPVVRDGRWKLFLQQQGL
jgi:hypothetical protein